MASRLQYLPPSEFHERLVEPLVEVGVAEEEEPGGLEEVEVAVPEVTSALKIWSKIKNGLCVEGIFIIRVE